MVKEKRISVRVGHADDQVRAMASALSTGAATVTTSDVYRTLLAEALEARVGQCVRRHVGPVRGGACGHCGAIA